MRTRHEECRNGIIEDITICENCKGTGSLGFNLGVGASKGENCPECNGKGKFIEKSKCNECVDGFIYACDFCGNRIEGEDSNVCATCDENPLVIELAQPLDYNYLDGKNALAGTVTKVHPKGINIDLNNGFIGWFKPPRNARFKQGQVIPVRLRRPLSREDRGKSVPLYYVSSDKKYNIVKKHLNVYDVTVEELTSSEGNLGKILVQITDIYVIRNGPTLYTLIDENGKVVQGSVYGEDGVQSYPYLRKHTIVNAIARYRIHNEKPRLQIYHLEKAKGKDALNFIDSLSKKNQNDGSPIEETNFFVDSSTYDNLKPAFVAAAVKIRNALLRNQNILVRYHSPCVDGAAAAFAIDYAIKRDLLGRGINKNEFRKYVRRLPQRNNIFEVKEVTRDLSFALDDGANYRNLPIYILVDIGSNEESKAALAICKSYGVDVVIVDSHAGDESLKELTEAYINPNSTEESLSTGMLAVELAKFITAEQKIDERVIQLAAISGHYKGVNSTEFNKYLEMSTANEFGKEKIENITPAVDYVLYGLRHFDGGEVLRNLLGVSGSMEKTNELIEAITPTAMSLYNAGLKIAEEHSETKDAGSGKVVIIDLDNYAPRYDYPSHSTILSALHNSKTSELESEVTVLGLASDYFVLRTNKTGFIFSEFLDSLQQENSNVGINGTGTSTNGFIQFLAGFKDKVLETALNTLSN